MTKKFFKKQNFNFPQIKTKTSECENLNGRKKNKKKQYDIFKI